MIFMIPVEPLSRHGLVLPDFAQVFITRLEARQMIYKLNQNSTLWVLELWDYDSHFVVTTQDDNRPSWLIPEIAA